MLSFIALTLLPSPENTVLYFKLQSELGSESRGENGVASGCQQWDGDRAP